MNLTLDCLLSVCLCVDIYIYSSSFDYNVRVLLFLSLWNRCRLLSLLQYVCPNDLLDGKDCVFAQRSNAVLVRPELAEDLTDLKNKKKKSECWTFGHTEQHYVANITCMASIKPHIVFLSLWVIICCPFFNTTEHCANQFKWMDFYAKETKYSPTSVHFKDCGAMDACGGFNAVSINS